MIIEPKIMGGVCLTAHPEGLKKALAEQISYVKSQKPLALPKRILVIGGSTGYGLATRIVSSFAGAAGTFNVSFEREPSDRKPASVGWYNNKYFDQEAHKAGLIAETLHADAFSHQTRLNVMERIKALFGQVDLVVYSLASPMRKDPDSGEIYKSVLKPLGQDYKAKSVDFIKGKIQEISLAPAEKKEVENTVKVMGGEDWTLWIKALLENKLLAKGAKTVAYSYIGPQITFPIYRAGSIGIAKQHLEKTAAELENILSPLNGKAFISVNKALVTRASSVIPVVPLYMSLLFKTMKQKGLHEGCIEQMYRLFSSKVYGDQGIVRDKQGLVRMDDWEMRDEIQNAISEKWDQVSTENLEETTDIAGFRHDFLHLHGFDWQDIDYEAEVDPRG